MNVRSFGFSRSRERRLLVTLALTAFLATTIGATTQAQAAPLAQICALKELAVITMIEDHGTAEDMPADRVSNATMTMLRARSICYEGRVSEALALYDSILALGPVASLRGQRP